MLTIYLVRHGETFENRKGVLQGTTPGHLTELGKKQAEELGAKLRGIKFDAVITSPLQRAVDTTHIIMKTAGISTEIEINPLLQERDWGSLTLVSCAEARKLKTLPNDVESLEKGMKRAANFVNQMILEHDGETILAVGHGFIDRCIISVINNVDKSMVPRMDNAECRIIKVRKAVHAPANIDASDDEASAN